MISRTLFGAMFVFVGLAGALPAGAQQLTVWHDKGDDGTRMLQRMVEAYGRDHPGVTVRSQSMPTDQWFSRTVAALNTNTAPDILFNDGFRLVQIQQQTRKLSDLGASLRTAPAADRAFLTDGDVAAATYDKQLIMVPFQRVVTAWGVRRSWLEKAGESFPKTWDDALRIGHTFQETQKNTFGMAMQGGDPSSMIGAGIAMLAYGNGAAHALVDDDGNLVIDQPLNARATIAYLKLYTQDKLVSPDTINQTFTDMYQLIEGGRVGQFRVGNWNVGKWDKTSPAGDYVVGPFPAVAGGTPSFVVGSVRGMAVPTNSPHAEAARAFVAFLIDKQAQQDSLDTMGGVVRSDLDTANVTPGLRPFVAPGAHLQAADNAVAAFPWELKLEAAYYKKLLAAISSPPADWDAWMKETAADLRRELDGLKARG